jgi:NDMA-dependent alcohol dehydrogenase
MRTRAAVLHELNRPFEIEELELDDPRQGEVLIKVAAAGLCHSDLGVMQGESVARLPIVGGHEASGVVHSVGPGVTKVAAGDHVVCSFIPSCGICRYCSTGRQNLCNAGANAMQGSMTDGTFRFRGRGQDIGGLCMLGAFSEYLVASELAVVKVDPWLPLDRAVLVGCGVPTGWGAAVTTAGVRVGDTAVIFGIGGVGINAVQGAVSAGAAHVICVDPVPFKREAATAFGASHAVATASEAAELVDSLTWGQGADQAILTVGTMDEEVVAEAFALIGKGGTLVLVGVAEPSRLTIKLSGAELVYYEKSIRGSLFGSSNPQYDIVRLLRLYDAGKLKLDELVTSRYRLDQINDGYRDLVDGKNIRGIVDFSLPL